MEPLRRGDGCETISYDRPPLAAPIELARQLVFGAIAYARELGFEPHPDLAACAGHLGPWAGSSDITFGRNGKPTYIQGPHDDAARIIRTLRRSVGDGNFDYVTQAVPDTWLWTQWGPRSWCRLG